MNWVNMPQCVTDPQIYWAQLMQKQPCRLHWNLLDRENGTTVLQLIYYCNQSFPNVADPLFKEDMKDCDSVLVKGFEPDKTILDVLARPSHIIVDTTRTWIPKTKRS